MNNQTIYLDNSTVTRVEEEVVATMKSYYLNNYAAATSEFAYTMGIEAAEALEEAREVIADALKANPQEIIFTSGATESNNLALKGIMRKEDKNKHLIVSKIEDFSVLKTAEALEEEGYEVTYLEVDEKGQINIEDLKEAVKENTVLVSIQHANQEIGTIQNIKEIAQFCRENDIIYHTDATHTFKRVPLDVKEIPADLITISAHTIHGPRGIGALYIREGVQIKKLMDGGFQEQDLRGGIENIPGAAGFARAVELVSKKENQKIKKLRDLLINEIEEKIDNVTLNGARKERIPQNANITFHFVEGESITLHLDMRGIAVNTGSACFSKSLEASHVIMGIGGDHERAHGSIRFSLSKYNTEAEIKKVVEELAEIVDNLREISPLTKGGKQ